ncbi:MAG: GntR family transcriptional regulator [bacterium]
MIRRARTKGIPLYYQLMRSLKEDILSGRFAAEDQLPSEAELTQIFKVSRVVVRQALQILEDEGLIVRIRGKGTFVAKDAVAGESPVLSGYIEDFLRVGLSTQVKVLHFGLVKASPDIASVFAVDESTDLFYVKRLRMVEGRAFSVIENHLPYSVGILIPLARIEDEPLMQLIETHAGIPIDWASQVFQAVSADSDLAHLLDIDLMAPVLKMTLSAHTAENQVVNHAHVYYRSDRYNHHGFLRRRRTSDYLGWTPVEPIHPTGP